MKVILTENVRLVGNIGEIVNVSPGHARNFLFPRSLAVFADESNKRTLENQKRALRRKIEEERTKAFEVKKKFDGLEIELVKKVGANGKLFGTITSRELSKELRERGIDLEKRLISIETPIKSIGTFNIKAKIFGDIMGEFQVKIKMNSKQREELKRESRKVEKKENAKEEKMAEDDKSDTKVEAKAEIDKKS